MEQSEKKHNKKNISKKKRFAAIGVLAVLLIAVPIVVSAIMYLSNMRMNEFTPGSVNVQIQENSGSAADTQSNELLPEENTDTVTIQKAIVIHNASAKDEEYVRVMLVPSWQKTRIDSSADSLYYDTAGGLTGNISDFRYFELNEENRTLDVYNGHRTLLMSLQLALGWNSEWKFSEDDHCFYHQGKIEESSSSSKLIESVILPKSVYEEAFGYELKVDVLCDTVQIYGTPRTDRENWKEVSN